MADLLSLSLSTGIVPKMWKHAIVKPLLKKPQLNPLVVGNFRSISLLPILGKVLEKHVNSIISQVFEENNILHQSQMGFHPGHSTESTLLIITHKLKILDQGGSLPFSYET